MYDEANQTSLAVEPALTETSEPQSDSEILPQQETAIPYPQIEIEGDPQMPQTTNTTAPKKRGRPNGYKAMKKDTAKPIRARKKRTAKATKNNSSIKSDNFDVVLSRLIGIRKQISSLQKEYDSLKKKI